jgi:SAM-dependent methyltransferase
MAEFDSYAHNYRQLLDDPIRNVFAPGGGLYFHQRKREIIQHFFLKRGRATSTMDWLDVGCGQGELLGLARSDFSSATGCDPSAGMLENHSGARVVLQSDVTSLPFADESFDFVTAVCVYHHVELVDRRRSPLPSAACCAPAVCSA